MTAHVTLVRADPDPESAPRSTPDAEEQWITRLVASLLAAFPEIPEVHIRDCVARLHMRFANARIRTYIPILVARQAGAVLARYSPTRADPLVG
jgi:hypothetical protein